MSNSFNISVKPEIAAAVVKIDAVKTDTADIRTDVTAIHDTDLPAVIPEIDAVNTLVTLRTWRTFILASDILLHSNDPRSDSDSLTYQKVKETLVSFRGVVRCYWEFRNYTINQDSWTKIYINGIAVGVEKFYNGEAFDPYTDDVVVNIGDLVQLYAKGSTGYPSVMTQNFRLKGDINPDAFTTLESI